MEPSQPSATELALIGTVRDMSLSNELINHGVPAAATLSIARLISSGFALDPKSMAIVSTDGKPVADAIRTALALPGISALLPKQTASVASSPSSETGAPAGSWSDLAIRAEAATRSGPSSNPYSPIRGGGSRPAMSGHYTTLGSIWDVA